MKFQTPSFISRRYKIWAKEKKHIISFTMDQTNGTIMAANRESWISRMKGFDNKFVMEFKQL